MLCSLSYDPSECDVISGNYIKLIYDKNNREAVWRELHNVMKDLELDLNA